MKTESKVSLVKQIFYAICCLLDLSHWSFKNKKQKKLKWKNDFKHTYDAHTQRERETERKPVKNENVRDAAIFLLGIHAHVHRHFGCLDTSRKQLDRVELSMPLRSVSGNSG